MPRPTARLFVCAAALAGTLGVAAAGEVAPVRQGELLHLLQHDCGSCHGMRLTGGLGPALTPEALEGRPRQLMVHTILEGRAGTPMPPWRGMLSASEVRWLVDVLYEGGLDAQNP